MDRARGVRDINLNADVAAHHQDREKTVVRISGVPTARKQLRRFSHRACRRVIVGQGPQKEQCRCADGHAFRIATTDKRDGVDSEDNAAVRALVSPVVRASDPTHVRWLKDDPTAGAGGFVGGHMLTLPPVPFGGAPIPGTLPR